MWIYSLGICLRLTISSKHIKFVGDIVNGGSDSLEEIHHYHHSNFQQERQKQQPQQHLYPTGGSKSSKGTTIDCNDDVNGGTSSLDQIILTMCDSRLTQRASLMFLLDVS